MLELVAKKSSGGDVCINLARQHLVNHEWGLARIAIQQGLEKGLISEPGEVDLLLRDVCTRLGIRGEGNV